MHCHARLCAQKLANSDSILIIDDVNCNASYCKGPSAAVARAVKEGVLEVRSVCWG